MIKIKLLTFLYLTALFFTSCNSTKTEEVKILSVTIEPQKYFLEQLVGNKFKVNCVVPNGSNPESFDLAPSQMLTVNKSLAYFKVGHLGIENTWINNIQETNSDIEFVDCSKGIDLIEEHVCDNPAHNHGHNHAHAGGIDPHTWSSPASAKIMVDNMYKAVMRLDNLNKSYYTENYDKVINEINRTDSIIKTYLDQAPSKSFIIFHPALSYFSQEYGLEQLTIEYEGKNPSPSQLKTIIDEAKKEGVKAVFMQQEFDPKNVETIADAIGVKPVQINLLSYHWSDEMIKIAKTIALGNE